MWFFRQLLGKKKEAAEVIKPRRDPLAQLRDLCQPGVRQWENITLDDYPDFFLGARLYIDNVTDNLVLETEWAGCPNTKVVVSGKEALVDGHVVSQQFRKAFRPPVVGALNGYYSDEPPF